MKLRNKKTGEIKDVRMSYREGTAPIVISETTRDENGQSQGWPYDSLAELNDEWEDAPEEPKENGLDNIISLVEAYSNEDSARYPKDIVNKLKAFRRLRDKGFRITIRGCKGIAWLEANWGNLQGDYSDVLFLFGGEE